jgi:3-oxoacyl-[acyl-carrier-protein] synthase-3
MALSTLHHVRYAGMASCVPKRVVCNLTDCPPAQRAERERLVRNIGIEQRRMAPQWQCFSDLAVEAAQALLARLAWRLEDIDALIVVTQSADFIAPATAIILQDRLGLPTTSVAFDVNLGCSAYPFGLHLLGSMISAGGLKKGLLLVGDCTATLDNPLFSDAATATALEFDAQAPAMHFDLNSDGSGYQAIMMPAGGRRQPLRIEHFLGAAAGPGETVEPPGNFILDGPAVLNFSTRQVPIAVERTLAYAGVGKEEVDAFVFHQANRMINDTLRRKLALRPEQTPSSLREFGNTSGASVPLTVTLCLRERLRAGPARLLLCGFGIGLSWGCCLVEVADAVFPDVVQA